MYIEIEKTQQAHSKAFNSVDVRTAKFTIHVENSLLVHSRKLKQLVLYCGSKRLALVRWKNISIFWSFEPDCSKSQHFDSFDQRLKLMAFHVSYESQNANKSRILARTVYKIW
jgi:hypothetical protein